LIFALQFTIALIIDNDFIPIICLNTILQIQKTAYKGTDFILFSNPKFFLEIRIAYSDLYFSMKTPKLFARFRLPFFTSIGTTLPSVATQNQLPPCLRFASMPSDSFLP